jgi:predicted small secreted protein
MIRNILLILGLGLTLAACNTVAGVGEDISSGANAVRRAL